MKISHLWICGLAATLAACSGGEVRETLGLDRKAPDEFVVYSRPPLSVPPEFDLEPPRPGEPPLTPSTEDIARETLLGDQDQPFKLDVSTEQEGDVTVAEGEEELTLPMEREAKSATAVEKVLEQEAPSGAAASFLGKAGVDEAAPDIRQQLGEDTMQEPERRKEATSLYERIWSSDEQPVVDPKGEAERLRQNKDEGKAVTEGETPVEENKPPSVIDQIF